MHIPIFPAFSFAVFRKVKVLWLLSVCFSDDFTSQNTIPFLGFLIQSSKSVCGSVVYSQHHGKFQLKTTHAELLMFSLNCQTR